MPCSDSSSSIALKLNHEEKMISFDFAKITCGREITAKTGFSTYCVGSTLQEILNTSYAQVVKDLGLTDEEKQFVLYLERDALRSAIAQYLGLDNEEIDKERCRIISVEHDDQGIEVSLLILPPKELPKILPCGLGSTSAPAPSP